MAIGCVLIKHGKVIVYGSRQHKVHETNYQTQDLELAAKVFSLKIWRRYLYGVHVDVYADHKNLQHVFIQKELNLRQIRWLEWPKDYAMIVLYHPSKANVIADTLCRMTTGNVSHIYEARNYLANDVHRLARLGMRLEHSPNGGFMFHSNHETLLAVEV